MLASVTLIGGPLDFARGRLFDCARCFASETSCFAQDDMGVGILRGTPILGRNAVSLGVVQFDPPRKRS